MKKLLLPLLTALFTLPAVAQEFTFGDYKRDDIDMTTYAKDPTAHAVVLNEFGKTWISSADNIPLVHEYHAKIKIFDTEAFDQVGTVEIPIYKIDNNYFEEVTQIQAITYYKDENGMVQKAELDPKKIFRVKENRYWDLVKFTLPNLRKGCVIEYKYHLESPLRYNFKNWKFQDYIPKIHSNYEAHIPAIYTYNVSLRGPFKLTDVKSELERECFSPGGGIKCDCSKINYVMNDIPAFVPEDYMTSPKNFMSAIYFELSELVDLSTGAKKRITKEWRDIDYDLKRNEEFGSQLKRTELMKDRTQAIIAGITDTMAKARAIYNYVQRNFKYNGITGIGSDDGIRRALDSHSGSVADINLTLAAALNSAGIYTEAVLLSTRNHGLINKLYPVQSDFNYVVAKANFGGKSYLLDATDPLLPFGLLPMQCINDQGRAMSVSKPSYWVDLVAAEKQTKMWAFDLTLSEDGKIRGIMQLYSKGYEAYNRRKLIKKFNTIDEFVEDLDNKLKKVKIKKFELSNLDTLEKPLSERYEIELDANLEGNRVAFNPFFIDRITENPFKLAERNYPVDRGAAFDGRFTLMMHLPPGYQIESIPQDVALAMPAQGGRFMVNYSKTDDGFNCSHITQFNKPVYLTDEYPYLKEIYNKIIQAESAEVVFSKK